MTVHFMTTIRAISKGQGRDYAMAFVIVLGLLLGLPLRDHIRVDVLAMVSLSAIVIIAARLGIGPALFGSVLSVMMINFFFIPPYYTFRLSDPYAWITLSFLLLTSLIVGSLTAQLSVHARQAQAGETQARLLYSLSKSLGGQNDDTTVISEATAIMALAFGAEVRFIRLSEAEVETLANETEALALKLAFTRARLTGRGSEHMAGASATYVPVILGEKTFAVMVIQPRAVQHIYSTADILLMKACAEVISNTINLIHSRDLAYQARASHEQEKLRNVLLSSLSHDLRTPLTLMNGSVSMILKQRKSLPRPVFDEITSLWTQLNRLQTFVSNLLRMAALTSKQMKLNFEAVSLSEILGAVFETLKSQKGARLISTHLSGQIPLVRADGALIEQVFINLIGNAIKHTQNNGRIKIFMERQDQQVRISIKDDGTGIPLGQENAIFNSFLSLEDKGTDRKKNMTGLGLAICQHIVAAHEGIIFAQNNCDQNGAIFTFTLPVWAKS